MAGPLRATPRKSLVDARATKYGMIDACFALCWVTLGPIMHVMTHYTIITLPLLAKYDWHVTGYYTVNSFELVIACNSNISTCVSG